MSMLVDYDPQSSIPRPTGVIQAIVSDIFDLGIKPDPFKPGKNKHQVAITWQLSETWENNGVKQPLQQTEIYNLSLNEKASLRQVVEGIIGKSLANGQNKISFDVESLLGTNCMLTLQYKTDKTGQPSKFTEVIASAPLMKNMQPLQLVKLPRPQWIEDLKNKGTAQDPSTPLDLDAALKAI